MPTYDDSIYWLLYFYRGSQVALRYSFQDMSKCVSVLWKLLKTDAGRSTSTQSGHVEQLLHRTSHSFSLLGMPVTPLFLFVDNNLTATFSSRDSKGEGITNASKRQPSSKLDQELLECSRRQTPVRNVAMHRPQIQTRWLEPKAHTVDSSLVASPADAICKSLFDCSHSTACQI